MKIKGQKILFIVGFLVVVILIAYLLYFFFLKPSIPQTTNINNANQTTNVNGGLPGAGANANIPINVNAGSLPPGAQIDAGQETLGPTGEAITQVSTVAKGGLTNIEQLTTASAAGVSLAADGSAVVYYNKDSGKFFKLAENGQPIALSDQVFYQVENITWSPDSQKAILEYPDGANVIYDFTQKKQVTLPSHWKDFSFSPDGNQIVFKSMGGTGPENKWLAIASIDGSSATKIENLGNEDATVYPDWSPNQQVIATFTKGLDLDRQNLFFVGLNGENFKSMTIDGRNFQGQWSPSGDRLLYSAYSSNSDLKPKLWITSAQGENIGQDNRSLGLETWADKCTFSNNDSLYCAVPKDLESGAGLFDSELDNSPCNIYKIDLKTGFKTRVAIPIEDHNIEKLIISENGRYLYFTSQTDGRLYRISLK